MNLKLKTLLLMSNFTLCHHPIRKHETFSMVKIGKIKLQKIELLDYLEEGYTHSQGQFLVIFYHLHVTVPCKIGHVNSTLHIGTGEGR